MTDRDRQRETDRLTAQFLAALDAGNLVAAERLWDEEAADPEVAAAFTDAAAELAGETNTASLAHADGVIESVLCRALPALETIRPSSGPLTVAEVSEQLHRRGVPGLTAAEFAVNDLLARCSDPLPEQLGLSAVIAWGGRFGTAPKAFWKAFRQAALELRLRRESSGDFQLAARPKPPKQAGGDT
jgi:hypothetical protein